MAGGGHIIIRSALKQALKDPIVFGQLTSRMQQGVLPILDKDEGEWTAADDHYVNHCIGWALHNCL